MKLYSVGVLFGFILLQQQCDLSGPRAKTSTEAALKPYFPQVQASIFPQQLLIQSLTCSKGVGPKIIEQLPKIVFEHPEYNQARQLLPWANLASVVGEMLGAQSARYKYWDIGFEDGAWRFDITQNRAEWIPSDQTARERYKQSCDPRSPAQASIPDETLLRALQDRVAEIRVFQEREERYKALLQLEQDRNQELARRIQDQRESDPVLDCKSNPECKLRFLKALGQIAPGCNLPSLCLAEWANQSNGVNW